MDIMIKKIYRRMIERIRYINGREIKTVLGLDRNLKKTLDKYVIDKKQWI
jgi:hypothetical protein